MMFRMLNVRYLMCGSLILFLLFGCNKTKVVLDQEKFTAMLIDMHMADAIIAQVRGYDAESEKKNYSYYNAIYEKYGVDKATFDSCMYHYSSQTELFAKIYDVVIDSLNKRLTDKTRLLAELKSRDSVNYYSGPDTVILDTGQMVYEALIDSVEPGLYKFSAVIKFDTIDKGINNVIKSYFVSTDLKDTLNVLDLKVFSDTLQHLYHWSQYVDTSYGKLVIRFVEADNSEKLKYRDARIWGITVFKPYLSASAEKRAKPMFSSQR